jgi:hypothetical protein
MLWFLLGCAIGLPIGWFVVHPLLKHYAGWNW